MHLKKQLYNKIELFIVSFIFCQIAVSQSKISTHIYFDNIYKAEEHFLNNDYDSAYINYVNAFKIMKKINPKTKGFLVTDAENFFQLQGYIKGKKKLKNIKKLTQIKTIYNTRISSIVDSLFVVDQNVRQSRNPYKTNDSINTIITATDLRNFNFLLAKLGSELPTEYEISEKSYNDLYIMFLHASNIEMLRPVIYSMIIKNVNTGIVNPRRFSNVIHLCTNALLIGDISISIFSVYNEKTKTTWQDDTLYIPKMAIEQIAQINKDCTTYYMPSVAHKLKCCCYAFNNPKSNLRFYTSTNGYVFNDYSEYLYLKQNAEIFNCNK